MTELLVPDLSARIAVGATGSLRLFNQAGVLDAADVHVATRVSELGGEPGEQVRLAVALAVRAARLGSVCVDLAEIADQPLEVETDPGADHELPWPATQAWLAAVAASTLVVQGVLRLEGTLLYLDRHWREERQVCDDLTARLALDPPQPQQEALSAALARLFGPGWDEQRDATEKAARQWTTVLTGGPGTGKTASVARMLVALAEQHQLATGVAPRIALAAPTGKAATRLQESVAAEAARLDPADQGRVAGLSASTLHRLLGWRPDNRTRFRHHRENPLPHDVIVVDEVSMVPLSLMARLLEAVRAGSRLILVGDKDQLASVEAGAVLADLVQGFETRADSPVVRLEEVHRIRSVNGADTAPLAELAQALRNGDADAVTALLTSGSPVARLVDPDDAEALEAVRREVVDAAYVVAEAAARPDAEAALDGLDQHRLLCAHREGPFGVSGWNAGVERLLGERNAITQYVEWYAGRPVLVTANDPGLKLSNGDLGVVVRLDDGRLRVVFRLDGEPREFATTRLSSVETVYAMTVHKSQGSEARAVTVVLPPEESPLLTRELFYTAVTRARERVTVLGTEASVRAAVERRVVRASGLAERLGEPDLSPADR